MCMGEGEELVRAVFSLTQGFSPCVVFLEGTGPLFGAYMLSCKDRSALAHQGVITKFMSEMDSL